MKKKLFAFFVLIFGMCGALSCFSLSANNVDAASVSASVWDGDYAVNENELTDQDWLVEKDASGTSNTYYIRSAKGLSYFAYSINKSGSSYMSYYGQSVKLETDIDLNHKNWTPIGGKTSNSFQSFKGYFDGQGHTIYNMDISSTSYSTIGFFGAIDENIATIKNLHLKNSIITLNSAHTQEVSVGTIIGEFNNADITNCSADGKIEINAISSNVNIGGVIGKATNSNIGIQSLDRTTKIKGVKFSGEISFAENINTSSQTNVGGLVGSATGTAIYNSANEGCVDLSNNKLNLNVGGLAGYAVATSTSVGKLSRNVVVYDSYNTGKFLNIFNEINQGVKVCDAGIVGKVGLVNIEDDEIAAFDFKNVYSNDAAIGRFINNYADANVNYSSITDSMLTAENRSLFPSNFTSYINAKNVYMNNDTNLTDLNFGSLSNLNELATSKGFYSNTDYWTKAWDFENVWQIDVGTNYGFPYIHIDGVSNDEYIPTGLQGSGTIADPYLIYTAGDLAYLSNNWDNEFSAKTYAYYSLQNDIDLSGKTWIPIAYNTGEYFSGVFDGNGHTISGMTCSLHEQFEYHALFAKTKNAVIKDLTIEDVHFVTEGADKTSPASLVGESSSNTYIINVADKSDKKTVSAGSPYVFFGENNWVVDESGNVIDYESYINCEEYTTGYVIEIDGNGGTFYNSSKDVYDKYRVLVNEDFSFASQNIDLTFAKNILPTTSERMGVSDTLIKVGYRLTGFEKKNGEDILLSNETVMNADNFSIILSNLGKDWPQSLTAVYEKATVELSINYNSEEKKFSATKEYVETFSVDYDAFLSEYPEVFTKYHSFDNELRPGFRVFGIYSDRGFNNSIANILHGGVVSWNDYHDYQINTNILDPKEIGSKDYSTTFYAKWEGGDSSTCKREININISKTLVDYKKNFDLKDSIISVKLTPISNDENIINQYSQTIDSDLIKITDLENGSLNLQFEIYTLFAANGYSGYKLEINLKDGYVLTDNAGFGSAEYFKENNDISENNGKYKEIPATSAVTAGEIATYFDYFGYLKSKPIEYTYPEFKDSAYTNLNTSYPTTAFCFYNLVDDYEIKFVVSRQEYQKPLDFGDSVDYVLAPIVDEYQNVKVFVQNGDDWNNGSYSTIDTITEDEKPYVGLNLLENYMLTSKGSEGLVEKDATGIGFDKINVTKTLPKIEDDRKVSFQYLINENGKEYYQYYFYELYLEKIVEETDNTEKYYDYKISLYEADKVEVQYDEEGKVSTSDNAPEDLTKQEQIAILHGQYTKGADGILVFKNPTSLSYLSYSSFALIFMTEDNASQFQNYSPTNTAAENGYYFEELVTFNQVSTSKNDSENQEESNESLESTVRPSKIMMKFENFTDFPTDKIALDDGWFTNHPLTNFSDKIKSDYRSEITVLSEYTEAYLEFEFYDESLVKIVNGTPENIASQKHTVGNSGQIEFDINASNYYKFAGENVVLFSDAENSNYNIKIEVQEGTVRLENEKDYVDKFNKNNTQYLTAVEDRQISFPFLKGQSYDTNSDGENDAYYESDGVRVVLNYNTSLKGGKYIVKIICEPVEYSLNLHTRFIDAADHLSDTGFLSDSTNKYLQDLQDEDNIKTKVINERTNEKVVSDGELESIRYDDQLEFNTELGNNQAYEFYGWYIQQNSATGGESGYYLKNDKIYHGASLSETYYSLNNQDNQSNCKENGEKDDSANRFHINVFAIYLKKQVEFKFTDSTKYGLVDLENPKDISSLIQREYPARTLGINISLNVDGNKVDSLTYKYSIDPDSESFSKINFELSGNSAAAYSVYGMALIDEDGNYISDVSGNNIVLWADDYADGFEGFDVHKIIKDKVEAGQTETNQIYYVMPILKQKEVSVVFHTGTGDKDNQYGDTRNGIVKNNIGEKVDNSTTFTVEGCVLYDTLTTNLKMNGLLSGQTETESLSLANLFYSRVGYSNPDFGYRWGFGSEKLGDSINLTAEYFQNVDDGGAIHFYRLWKPNTYNLVFETNGGMWSGSSVTKLEQVFDADAITAPKNLSKVGYKFMGWSFNGQQVFDENGQVIKETVLYDSEGKYIYPNNVELQAIWQAKPYNIVLYFNGANSYQLGTENKVEITENQLYYTQEYLIVYDTTFANLYGGAEIAENEIDILNGNILKLSDIVLERLGFVFNGFYLSVGFKQIKIEDSTVFNNALSNFVDNQNSALVLYANWTFDESSLDFDVVDVELDPRDYDGTSKTIYLSEYFTEGNYSVENFEIDLTEKLKITLNEKFNSTLKIELINVNADQISESDLSFSVKNAGDYTAKLKLSVEDNVETFNLSTFWQKEIEFKISINKIDIRINQEETQKLSNATRIMEGFFEEALTATTFQSLVLKADPTFNMVSASDDEIYEFIMTKYYLLLTESSGSLSNIYRQWTYVDFQTYKLNNAEKISQIVDSLKYFDFYNETAETFVDINSIYNVTENFSIAGSMFDDSGSEELGLSTAKIYSKYNMDANALYEIRVYISSTNNSLGNYNVLTDDNGEYLIVGKIMILPKVIKVIMLGNDSSYYQSGAIRALVDWQGDRESFERDLKTYYKIDDDLYLSAKLYTSNAGENNVDTKFTGFDSNNWLYFENVDLLKGLESDTVYSMTKNYKVLADGEYTILNTNGVAQISVLGKKLTKQDEALVFEDLPQNIFDVSSVVYYIVENGEKVEYEKTDLDWMTSGTFFHENQDGTKELIFQITENEGQKYIFVNERVVSISFTTPNLYLDQYTALHKWSNRLDYYLTGEMEANNAIDFAFDFDSKKIRCSASDSEIEFSDAGVTNVVYYGIFTDLVLVNYDYNMPGDSFTNITSALKLGVDTYESLNIPQVAGFNLTSLTEKVSGADLLVEVNRTQVFKGANGVFVGLESESIFDPINLAAKWSLQDMQCTQILTAQTVSTYSFNGLSFNRVVNITNQNTDIFDYSFAWQYYDETNSVWTKPNSNTSSDRLVGQNLTLNDKGSLVESGRYKLIITAKIKSSYQAALDDSTTGLLSKEFEFSLEFMPIKVLSISMTGTSSIYNGQDKIKNLNVIVEYASFVEALGDYVDETTGEYVYKFNESQIYSDSGNVYFVVTLDGQEISKMKDVGEYLVEVCFNSNIYDISELSNNEFTYEITPFTYDMTSLIESNGFDFSKPFNSSDPDLSKKVFAGYDAHLFTLSRTAGEDLGNYDVFIENISSESLKNYILKYNDKIICESGSLTSDAKTFKVGDFSITASKKLIVSYDTTSLSEKISAPYIEGGYKLKINGTNLEIVRGADETIYKTLALKLFDNDNQKYLSGDLYENYIKDLISTLTINFFNSQVYDPAENTLIYSYKTTNSEELAKYYLNVEFDKAFEFEIEKCVLNVASIKLEKVYDGTSYQYFDFDLKEISDFDNYVGGYIIATYSNIHVGTNISGIFELARTDGTAINIDNYKLSAETFVNGKIVKTTALLSFNLKSNQFVYGDVNINNLEEILDSSNPFDLTISGQNAEDLLYDGYYNITYSLAEGTLVSESGFVYVGSYELQAIASFDDFEITLNLPSFNISTLAVSKNIPAGLVTILNTDTVQESYLEQMQIATGETVELSLVAQGVDFDSPASGKYNLAFADAKYTQTLLDGNIVVSINQNNYGLVVVDATEVLFVEIEDESILSQEYNGNEFEISSDLNEKTVKIGENSSSLKFYTDTATKDNINVNFDSFNIVSATGENSLSKKVEKTKLVLNASATGYVVVFEKNYEFVVTAKTIDCSKLSASDFNKEYDGTRTKTLEVSTTAGKIDGDNLSLRISYSSDLVSASGCAITVSLQGSDRGNYILTNAPTTAYITKAQAIVELSKTQFEYGSIKSTSNFAHTVKASGKTVSNTMYTLAFEVYDAGTNVTPTYSNGYLQVGTYDVVLKSSSSNYYDLTFDKTQIYIAEKQLNLVFDVAGGYKIPFDDPMAQQQIIDYSYETKLNEVITLKLTRKANDNGNFYELGDYFVDSAQSTNKNYQVASVKDNVGFIRITKAKDIVYLLASSEDTLSENGTDGLEIQLEYSAYNYDMVRTEKSENGFILSVLSSDSFASKRQFILNAYNLVYSEEVGGYIYRKIENSNLEGLTASLTLAETARNVRATSYKINAEAGAYCENYDIRFGKNGKTYAFDLYITTKQIYLKQGNFDGAEILVTENTEVPYFSRQFNNENVSFEIENASSILTGLFDNGVSNYDVLGLKVEFLDGLGNVAKRANASYYDLSVSLIGEVANNYTLIAKLWNGEDIEGEKQFYQKEIRAQITQAPMTIYANSQAYNYGELKKDANDAVVLRDMSFDYDAKFELDEEYIANYINGKMYFQIDSPIFSQSDSLAVGTGEYNVHFSSENTDFYYIYFIDGEEAELSDLKVSIFRKTLEFEAEEGQSLSEIFTKVYDGDNLVKKAGYFVKGLIEEDDVSIGNALFATNKIGTSINVYANILGEDSENYEIKPYEYGVIEAIVAPIEFELDGAVTDIPSGLKLISQLKYPFLSTASITANANTKDTSTINNFPNKLFKTGWEFASWTMNFDLSQNTDSKKTFLDANTKGMTTSYDEDTKLFVVNVGNNAKTISLLSALFGSDTENLFGYYYTTYAQNGSPAIRFYPTFTRQKLTITINIVDQNKNFVDGGSVELSYNGSGDIDPITKMFVTPVEYGTQISLKATANDHYYFLGYEIDGNEYSGDASGSYTTSGITKTTIIYVKFAVQGVTLNYDLSDIETQVSLPDDFENGKFVSDYQNLKNKTLNDVLISSSGYTVTEFEVDIDGSKQTILKENFDTTFASLLEGNLAESVTIILKPILSADAIAVSLNYNYDSKVEEIFVEYNSSYESSNGWVEQPTRDGYQFAGWWTENGLESDGDWGLQIIGSTFKTDTNPQTLYAKWNIGSFALKLIANNARISEVQGVDLAQNGNEWSANAVEYQTSISFVLTAMQGYKIAESGWEDCFDITYNVDGTANVVLTMPAYDFEYVLLIKEDANTVTINMQNIQSLSYQVKLAETVEGEDTKTFDTAESSLTFDVKTERTLILTVSVCEGYSLKEENVIFENYLNVSFEYDANGYVEKIVVEGINNSTQFDLIATEKQNKIKVVFGDSSRIEIVRTSAGQEFENIQSSIELEITTGEEISIYVKYINGYTYDHCTSQEYTVELSDGTGAFEGYAVIKISDIAKDGQIRLVSKKLSYKVIAKVISYDSTGAEILVDENIVYLNLNGLENQTSLSAQIGSIIGLSFVKEATYTFAGWSIDGRNVVSTSETYSYELTAQDIENANENSEIYLYGIFSKLQYNVSFATYSSYTIYDEYNDLNKVQTVYKKLTSSGKFFDEEGNQITSTKIYYGANKTILFEGPNGYKYTRYGYIKDGSFVEIGIGEQISNNTTKVKLASKNVEEGMEVCFLVEPLSLKLNIRNMISYDGVLEAQTEDLLIGSTVLHGANNIFTINRYGYIDGTKVHYENGYFDNEMPTSESDFQIVAYSGDVVYLKVKVLRSGYKFQDVISRNGVATVLKVEENEEYVVYEIRNIVGNESVVGLIDVVFKPQINVINLIYKHNSAVIDGGAFDIRYSDQNKGKIFTSGSEYSSLVVSAYTDTQFEVVAFIKSGFFVNPANLELAIQDSGAIIEKGSIRYEEMSVLQTGYTGKITFTVKDYLGSFDILISLDNLKYTVNLKDGADILATIKNVEFGELLNLSEENADNISIIDERFGFVNGSLQTIITLEDHNFEGYFTGENGSGVQYINSQSEAVNYWNESGYVFDNLNSKYVLSENAYIDEETGEIIIDLYVYLSYLKTRINFELIPNVDIDLTAQDMITGVDYSNSWFYATSPMYIEVAYDTDIYFNAPEIDGYIFYKFIISQRNAAGEWLSDVVSLTNNVPWSTNEYAQIVECKVQVIYYAKIDISIVGGDADVVISQEGTAKEMLANGYVDTAKEFTVSAMPKAGYEFLYWKNKTYAQTYFEETFTTSSIQKLALELYLQGNSVVLSFAEYDTTFGQIWSLTAQARDGLYKNIMLGTTSGNMFVKLVTETSTSDPAKMIRVGDVVTFAMTVDYGFGVLWNLPDIQLVEIIENYYYFEMTISSECAGQTIEIIPTFTDEILSFYTTLKFDEINEDAIDMNYVEMAGHLTYKGDKIKNFTSVKGEDVNILIVASKRYAVNRVLIENYSKDFEVTNLVSDNMLKLTSNYLQSSGIVGTIHVVVEFKRVFWKNLIVAEELNGEGTAENKYRIESVEDLALAMKLINSGALNSSGMAYKDAHYVLTADLELENAFWTPIGTVDNAFNGEFDFGKFKISGVYNAYFFNPISYNGLFGVLGADANIHETNHDLWYILGSVAIFVVVVGLVVVLILVNRRKKKKREALAHK